MMCVPAQGDQLQPGAECLNDDCLLEPSVVVLVSSLNEETSDESHTDRPVQRKIVEKRVTRKAQADRKNCRGKPVWLTSGYRACTGSQRLIGTVRFALASSELTTTARRQLAPIAAKMRQHAHMRVALKEVVSGGKVSKKARALGAQRARAVQMHLSRLGVSQGRVITRPVTPTKSGSAGKKGRAAGEQRLEITVIADAVL